MEMISYTFSVLLVKLLFPSGTNQMTILEDKKIFFYHDEIYIPGLLDHPDIPRFLPGIHRRFGYDLNLMSMVNFHS